MVHENRELHRLVVSALPRAKTGAFAMNYVSLDRYYSIPMPWNRFSIALFIYDTVGMFALIKDLTINHCKFIIAVKSV